MAKSIIPVNELPVIDKKSESFTDRAFFNSGAVILIDKPLEWSSFDVVKYVRIRIPAKKVGHAGTLDPLATGLLILCSGKATRSITQIQSLKKTYIAKIKFGASTPSFDSETEPDVTADWDHINEKMTQEVLENNFKGIVFQKPPAYSAIKVEGERLYKRARSGKDVILPKREIEIHEVNILDFSLPEITIRVHCGKGTYIRSLAHDLGIALNSRAYLTELRRIATGHFSVNSALTPHEFNERIRMSRDG